MILGLGTDIVEIARLEAAIRRNGDAFCRRIFTERELAEANGRLSYFAGRWAAKEAVLKALGTGWSVGIAWTDVEVVKLPSGAVSVALAGGAARRAEELGVTEVLLTLSHGKNHAVAFAVAQGQ